MSPSPDGLNYFASDSAHGKKDLRWKLTAQAECIKTEAPGHVGM